METVAAGSQSLMQLSHSHVQQATFPCAAVNIPFREPVTLTLLAAGKAAFKLSDQAQHSALWMLKDLLMTMR